MDLRAWLKGRLGNLQKEAAAIFGYVFRSILRDHRSMPVQRDLITASEITAAAGKDVKPSQQNPLHNLLSKNTVI